jgi:hypothetical protein
MPCPSHPPWLDHSNYTWRIVNLILNKIKLEVGRLRAQLSCDENQWKSQVCRKYPHEILPHSSVCGN